MHILQQVGGQIILETVLEAPHCSPMEGQALGALSKGDRLASCFKNHS